MEKIQQTQALEKRIILFYEINEPESEQTKKLLDNNKINYTIVPCKGIPEPEISIAGTRYAGYQNIKNAIEEK